MRVVGSEGWLAEVGCDFAARCNSDVCMKKAVPKSEPEPALQSGWRLNGVVCPCWHSGLSELRVLRANKDAGGCLLGN